MMRPLDWMKRPRESKLANVLYPNLSDAETQKEVSEIARSEGKKSPLQVHQEGLQPNQRSKWYAKDR